MAIVSIVQNYIQVPPHSLRRVRDERMLVALVAEEVEGELVNFDNTCVYNDSDKYVEYRVMFATVESGYWGFDNVVWDGEDLNYLCEIVKKRLPQYKCVMWGSKDLVKWEI